MSRQARSRRWWRARGGLAALALLAVFPPPPSCLRAAQPANEEQIKATMLFQVLQFVQWPPGHDGMAVRLCVLGRGRLQEAVREAAGQQPARGLHVAVAVIDRSAEAAGCDVIFVAAAADRDVQALVAGQGVAALTVAGREGFARRGGMVNFVYEGGRIGLEINPAAGERHGIRFSSRLLRLARIVGSEVVN